MMPRRTIISIALTLSFLSAAFIFLWVVFNAGPVATGKYLAAQVGSAIGVTVSIPPNPFSTLAQQLKEKEFVLSDKEQELQQKEAALKTQSNQEQNAQNKILLSLFVLGGILLSLILLNFYLDYRRKRQ